MKDKDILKDLFSDKLRNYEAPVRPELWSSISSKIGSTAATGSTVGTSLLSKLIIVSSITAASIVGGYFIYSSFNSDDNSVKKNITNIGTLSANKNRSKEQSSGLAKDEIKILQNNKASQNKGVINQSEKNFDNQVIIGSGSGHGACYGLTEEAPIPVKTDNVLPIKLEPPVVIENIKPSVITPNQEKKEPVNIEQTFTESQVELNLPNVFTPNNDGDNDVFTIQSKGLKDFSLVVMDMKNNTVFKTSDPDFVWNGMTLNGEMVESGNYVYYLMALDENNKPVNKYKVLTIRR